VRRRYFADVSSRWIGLADGVVVLASVSLALTIRAQFEAYLVGPLDIVVLLPWLIVLRVLTNILFEHYTLTIGNFSPRDFSALLLHNLLPTAIMTALRLLRVLRPDRLLQMPLSVIGVEYIFTCFGFMIVRLVALRLLARRDGERIYHRPQVLLFGEVREILDSHVLARLAAINRVKVVGILTSNALHWDAEIHGIRVYGDETRLPVIVSLNDAISRICFVDPRSEARAEIYSIIQAAQRMRMDFGIVRPDGEIESTTVEALLDEKAATDDSAASRIVGRP
jgi:FlaA1/EpsC-like NDP-sugar epimerase